MLALTKLCLIALRLAAATDWDAAMFWSAAERIASPACLTLKIWSARLEANPRFTRLAALEAIFLRSHDSA